MTYCKSWQQRDIFVMSSASGQPPQKTQFGQPQTKNEEKKRKVIPKRKKKRMKNKNPKIIQKEIQPRVFLTKSKKTIQKAMTKVVAATRGLRHAPFGFCLLETKGTSREGGRIRMRDGVSPPHSALKQTLPIRQDCEYFRISAKINIASSS